MTRQMGFGAILGLLPGSVRPAEHPGPSGSQASACQLVRQVISRTTRNTTV